MLGEPLLRGRAVLLAGMEIATQVRAPGLVRLADEPAPAEKVRRSAFPRAPFPQRAIAAQVVDRLAQGVAQEDGRDAAHPDAAPLMAAAQRLVDVEGGALVLGFFRAVPQPQ